MTGGYDEKRRKEEKQGIRVKKRELSGSGMEKKDGDGEWLKFSAAQL